MSRRALYELSDRTKRRLLKQSLETIQGPDNSPLITISPSSSNYCFSATINLQSSVSDKNSNLITEKELVVPSLPNQIDNIWESNRDCEYINSLSSSENDDDEQLDIRKELQKWGITHQVPQNAVSDLLKILKTHQCFSYLPSDSRTLFRTPKSTPVREVLPGNYCHMGIEEGIKSILNSQAHDLVPDLVKVHFNIDGIPIHKSTNTAFWPILGSIRSFEGVFVVGIYEGTSKPADVNCYLEEFVSEAINLFEKGIYFNNKKINFIIEAFVCDAPARAFVTNIKYHTGYYSCGKCSAKGKIVDDRVVLIKVDATLRTDSNFRSRQQPQHHNGYSIIEKLPVDMVQTFPFEYMHLICLGVTKKLLTLWTAGKVGVFRLPLKVKEKISKKIVVLGKQLPFEFNRKQRPLAELCRWKATELRTFLLYIGPIALKKYLPQSHYELFMCLSVAIRILAIPSQNELNISYADSLLKYFLQQYKIIFGRVNVSYNIHGLLHLAADVRNLGSLDEYSAFKFENKLGQIKKLIRKSSGLLSQVHRRLLEQSEIEVDIKTAKQGLKSSQKKSSFNFGKFRLKSEATNKTNCVFKLQSGEIGILQRFVENLGEVSVVCRKVINTKAAFTYPCESATFNILEIDTINLSAETKLPIAQVISKFVVFSISDSKSIIFPLLHCN